ncbi:SPOSA6832_00950, partial [Sporobolomyces salmonicolor]
MPPTPSTSNRPASSSQPNHGSLSSIVSHLVRSSLGSSAAAQTTNVPDDELDKHVADLLLQEAKHKDKLWGERGTRAYYDPTKEKNAAVRKPNTRFLSAVIRNVDDHNAALRRADAEAARKREREERDAAERWRRDRRRETGDSYSREEGEDEARAKRRRRRNREEPGLEEEEEEEEIVEDKWARRRARAGSDEDGREEGRPSRREKHDDRSSRHDRPRGVDDERSSRRHRDRRSASPRSRREVNDADRRPSRRDKAEDDTRRPRHRSSRSEHDRDPDRDDLRQSSRSDGPEAEGERSSTSSSKGKERALEDVFAEVEDELARDALLDPAEPFPSPSRAMDKYFSPTYDPRFDFTLDAVTDPSTGLVGDAGFDAWDGMISLVKARKEDKKEKEWREKEERRRERDQKRKEREERRRERKRRRRGEGSSASGSGSESDGEVGPRYDPKTGLMEVKYAKQGATREWDLGKETPT